VQAGIAKFRDEDSLTLQSLSKIHWRETIPGSRQIPQLQADFYCHLRRFLGQSRAQSTKDATRLKDNEKAESLSRDIVNVRIKKIVSLAAAPIPPEEMINNLTLEERALYRKLNAIVDEWKTKILSLETEK
jgi:DNA replication initiation complex subunit (GINS family)